MREFYQKRYFPKQREVDNDRIWQSMNREREALAKEFDVLDQVIKPRDFGF